MKISLQKHGLSLTEELTDHTMQAITKLSHYSERIIEAQVQFRIDNPAALENKIVEIKLVIPGSDLFAEKRSDNFERSLAECIDAMEHQLRKWKQLRG